MEETLAAQRRRSRGCSSSCSRRASIRRATDARRRARAELVARTIEDALDAVDEPRRGPHPAQLPRRDSRDAAHELLPARTRRRRRSRTSRSSSIPRSIPDLPAPRPMFEIFVYSPRVEGVHLRGGAGRPRRHALVRSARGLPHRGPRPDEGADGEERRHRAGRRQGRLRAQAAADRPATTLREEVVDCYRTFIRGLLDVTDNIVDGKVVAAAPTSCATTATTRTSSSPPTRARRRSPTSPTRIAGRVRLLAGRRVRVGRLGRLRPQGDGHHRARRVGVASSATSASSASTSQTAGLHRRRHRRHVGRRLRQRHAAVARTSSWSAAFDHRHVFLDPIPTRPRASPSASACSSCRARRGPTTTRALISTGGGVFPRTAKSIPLSPRGAGACSASTARRLDADRADPRDPARARRPAVERRHRHVT